MKRWIWFVIIAVVGWLLYGASKGRRVRRSRKTGKFTSTRKKTPQTRRTAAKTAVSPVRTVRRNSRGQIINSATGKPYNVKNAPRWVRLMWVKSAQRARKKRK